MKSDPEVAAFLDAVSQPLENDPPARDWVAADLTARLAALPSPPTGALTVLTQRLLAHWERRRFGWIVVAVAIVAVAITGAHLLLTTTTKTSAANPTWVLASLSGTQRLAAAVLLDGEHAEARAKAYVKAAPNDLAARELWLVEAPDGNEEMRKFVAECERQLRLSTEVLRYQTVRLSELDQFEAFDIEAERKRVEGLTPEREEDEEEQYLRRQSEDGYRGGRDRGGRHDDDDDNEEEAV